MSIITYNKLVRDKIPAVISEAGKTCEIEVLDDESYANELAAKLEEEIEEFKSASQGEIAGEIADIMEVLYAIAATKGISEEEIESTRLQKKEKRGGFVEKIFLRTVSEK